MRIRSTTAVMALVAVVAGASALLAFASGTSASFTDSEHATPSRAGAATVVLGRGGAGPDLGFEGLEPGESQTVHLRVDYQGSVPAELSMSVAAEGESAFCQQADGRWVARAGVPVTIAVGPAAAVSYCALYDGRRLPLGAAAPGEAPTVPVTLTLAADAAPTAAGLAETDAVTVHAEGGFTDRATGPLTATTTAQPPTTPPLVSASATVALPGATATVELDVLDPAAAARSTDPGESVALPEECVDSGIEASAIVEVVAVDPVTRVFDGAARGLGAGPFLVLGTPGDDRIIGSVEGDCVVGGGGADVVTGGDGDDVAVGGSGADVLHGDAGLDHLFGGAGLDELLGGADGDVLDGGAGSARCDAAPDDTTRGCLAPPPIPTSTSTSTPPPPPATPTETPTETSTPSATVEAVPAPPSSSAAVVPPVASSEPPTTEVSATPSEQPAARAPTTEPVQPEPSDVPERTTAPPA